jgi:small acid-soluble spore protein I (minor)
LKNEFHWEEERMNLNLRQAIIRRIQDKSSSELREVIEDSIGSDERSLPGLGVLFEIIWQNSAEEMQHQMTDTLHQHLNNHANGNA